MRSALFSMLGVALAVGAFQPPLAAEGEAGKALPTLLIKGEVVSLDTNDPAATLLKVKDRYGFETPILVTSNTQITQGDVPLSTSNLAPGSAVEVEYNFDVNTAKRHAVFVKMAPSAQSGASASPVAAHEAVLTESAPVAAGTSDASSASPKEDAAPATP